MNSTPRFFGTVLKVAAALIISVVIITVIGGQNKKQGEITGQAFNMLRESLLSAIPDQSQADQEQVSDDLEIEESDNAIAADMKPVTSRTDNTITRGSGNTGEKLSNALPAGNQKAEDTAPARQGIMTAEALTRSIDEAVEPPEMAREFGLADQESSKKMVVKLPDKEKLAALKKYEYKKAEWEAARDTMIIIESELRKLEDFEVPMIEDGMKIMENFEVDTESISGLISQAIEISINEFSINKNDMEILIEAINGADKNFDITDLDFEEVANLGRKFALLNKLKERMKKIAIEEGGEEDCNYHIPMLKINKDLEIIGFYQAYDCHPDIADAILKRVQKLPEWRKLAKRYR